jgi:hypothetical protein
MTNHQLRKQALEPYGPITCKEQYLKVIKDINDTFKADHPELKIQYVLNIGLRIGVVVLFKEGDQLLISGSALHGPDRWNREVGFFLATHKIAAAINNENFNPAFLPVKCQRVAAILINRYFDSKRKFEQDLLNELTNRKK